MLLLAAGESRFPRRICRIVYISRTDNDRGKELTYVFVLRWKRSGEARPRYYIQQQDDEGKKRCGKWRTFGRRRASKLALIMKNYGHWKKRKQEQERRGELTRSASYRSYFFFFPTALQDCFVLIIIISCTAVCMTIGFSEEERRRSD